MSAELVSLVQAVGLKKCGAGGGDGTEAITVHEVPLGEIEGWLKAMQGQGKMVDPKVYAGLYFIKSRQQARVSTPA